MASPRLRANREICGRDSRPAGPFELACRRFRLHWIPLVVAAAVFSIGNLAADSPNLTPEKETRVLELARDVLALSITEALEERPIRVTGVVTAADSTWGTKFFVQDETGGVFSGGGAGIEPRVGDLVEVEGVSGAGSFAPYISHPKWRVLGQRPLPEAKHVSVERIASGVEDGLRVEVAGLVRTTRWNGVHLELEVFTEGRRIPAEIDHAEGLNPAPYVGAKIRFFAVVAASQFKANSRQLVAITLFIASPSDLTVESSDASDPFAEPVLPLGQIGEFRRDDDPDRRVHVRGVVSLVEPGVVYITDPSGGLEVRTENPAAWNPGDVVDAAGFSELVNFLPVVNDAEVRRSGEPSRPLAAREATAADLASGLYHSDYVQVTGRLLESAWKPSGGGSAAGPGPPYDITLVMQSGRSHFTAGFLSDRLPANLPQLAPGGLLALRGVSAASADARGNMVGFHLLLPSLAAVRVLEAPSFLTRERLLFGLCIALAILAVLGFWSLALSRRNSRLAEKVQEKKAIMAERARLAVDLHDTLQQALYGVRLQLDAVREYLGKDDAEAEQHLGRARRFIEQGDSELRRTLCNLRASALDGFDLAAALERSARSLENGSGLVIEAATVGKPRPLPPQVEENVLRIGQEALTNIMKHARASRIQVTLAYADAALALEIEDDGAGFDPARAPVEGGIHFGLESMRERASRVGGEFSIESSPGRGAKLRLRVPLAPLEARPPAALSS